MNRDKVVGKAKDLAGKIQRRAGQALDDPAMAAKGAAKQVEGKAQQVVGGGRRGCCRRRRGGIAWQWRQRWRGRVSRLVGRLGCIGRLGGVGSLGLGFRSSGEQGSNGERA